MSRQIGIDAVAAGEVLPSPAAARRRRLEALAPYVLLLPSLAFLAVLVLWPMFQALLLAFQDQHTGALTTRNFHTMLTEYTFWPAVRDTLLFMLAIIPVEFVLALAMALILQSGVRGHKFFLYVWTIPLAISDLAAGIVWLSIFTQNGYINSLLVDLHLSSTGFDFLSYNHPVSLFICAVIAEIWRSSSLVMLILLGGLQGIPREYGEAADVFGAGFWQRIRFVTLPLLKPSIRVALILRTIFAFQVFAVVMALVGTNLPVLGQEAYNYYVSYLEPNVAATFAVLILVLSMAGSLFYLTVLRTRPEQGLG